MSEIRFWVKIVFITVGEFLKIFLPVVLWVGIGHYYFQFPLDVTLLACIAVQVPTTLLASQQGRDFYVVQHLGYDLVFKEHRTVTYVTADRGPLIGGYSRSFSDFGAAKAFFEHIEGSVSSSLTTEEVNHIYLVRGRKPPDESFLGKAYAVSTRLGGRVVTEVEPPGELIMGSPFSMTLAHRRAACEEYRASHPTPSFPKERPPWPNTE